jgi:hypothetical protein
MGDVTRKGGNTNAYWAVVGTPEGMRQLGRPGRRWGGH